MNAADIEPRRATLADLAALWPLLEAFCAEDGHPFERSRIEGALVPLLIDDSFGQVWVVEGPERLEAYAVVTWGYSLESGGRECLVDEIYVDTKGRSTGSRLLRAALAGAADAGARAVFLETEDHNHRARAFYARHGFELEDSRWMSRRLLP